jgi:hypothetical protein
MQQILTNPECHVKFFSIMSVLNSNVYSLQTHMATAFQVSPVVKVIEAVGEVTDILKVFQNVCATTPRQCLYFRL